MSKCEVQKEEVGITEHMVILTMEDFPVSYLDLSKIYSASYIYTFSQSFLFLNISTMKKPNNPKVSMFFPIKNCSL